MTCEDFTAKRSEIRGGVRTADLERRGCVRRQVNTPSVTKWRVCGPKTEVCYSGREPAWRKKDLENNQRDNLSSSCGAAEAQSRYKQWDPGVVSTKVMGWFIW
jgi:hypothetical protein